MPCIESLSRSARRGGLIAGAAVLAACGTRTPAPAPAPAPPAAAVPSPAPRPPAAPPAVGRPALPALGVARSWEDFRRQAALRIVAANPQGVYHGPVPDPLLAIPVLEIELNGDGSIRHVKVLRYPRQAKDTTQLAIDAVHRAAPFGPVAHLPQPWKFAEVFLFDDDRRFKPRTLDE